LEMSWRGNVENREKKEKLIPNSMPFTLIRVLFIIFLFEWERKRKVYVCLLKKMNMLTRMQKCQESLRERKDKQNSLHWLSFHFSNVKEKSAGFTELSLISNTTDCISNTFCIICQMNRVLCMI
jgi:hypothetical protein